MESSSSVGVQKMKIRELVPYAENIMVIGVIICKQKPKKFTPSNESEELRAVFNFTIRDSPTDYMNVTCWGTDMFVSGFYERFQIGDVAQIMNPIVELRKIDDYGEQFQPMVTSPFKMILNEKKSQVTVLLDGYPEFMNSIIRLPTKPIINYVALADIQANTKVWEGKFVDILVAISSIGDARNVKTKLGDSYVRNLVVFDYTATGFGLSIWDSDFIYRASLWKSRYTILFMTDVRISFDNYQKRVRATFTSKTIVTEDPDCKEARDLREYARTAVIAHSAILDKLSCSYLDPSTIQNVMNIQQINTKIDEVCLHSQPEEQFTALLYAAITYMDLDGLSTIVTTRCTLCKCQVSNLLNKCENVNCIREDVPAEVAFDLKVKLSDHTGSLLNCKITGATAERILKCKVSDFLNMSDDEKTILKWKFLLERHELRVVVLCVRGRLPIISIVGCNMANPTVMNQRSF